MDFSKAFAGVEGNVVRVEADLGGGRSSVGTGVVLSDGKQCLTCAHVIPGFAVAVSVMFVTGARYAVSVTDRDDALDLAILDTSRIRSSGVSIATRRAIVGEECFFVGYPMSVDSITAGGAHVAGFFQNGAQYRLDASVNQGNSGGPLFNADGALLGTITAKHGSLSQFLQAVRNHKSIASMSIGGLDPVVAIKQLISEMERNLNLGIGYAIPIDVAIAWCPSIRASP